jgi:glutathione peroxidase
MHAYRSLMASAALAAALTSSASAAPVQAAAENAYAFSFTSIESQPLPLQRYRGKAILVVNTASFCGFTRQYANLQSVWSRYRDRGLVVLAVPSNDFGNQEPGSEAEIKQFCEVNFDVDFPLTAKANVTGSEAHPFYRWAVAELGPGAAPRWNFHKYLVSPDGELVASFSTMTPPTAEAVTRAIEANLPKVGG